MQNHQGYAKEPEDAIAASLKAGGLRLLNNCLEV